MAVLLLNAATATGAGSAFTLRVMPTKHTVAATMGGTVVATAVTVDLEGSIDNSTWFTLASHVFTAAQITAEAAMFHVIDKPVRYARLNLITLTGGNAPTVTGKYDHQ